MKNAVLTLAAVALILTGKAQNSEIEFIDNNIEEAMNLALETEKLIFVDAYTTWCGPCKWMAANIFTNDEVATFYNENFVNLKLNMEKGDGKDFAKKYTIRAYPTLLFIDAKGQLQHKKVGAERNPEDYIMLGEIAQSPEKRLSGMHKRFNAGENSLEFIVEYLSVLTEAREPSKKALEVFYEEQEPTNFSSPEVFEVIKKHDESVDSKAIMYILENREEFEEKYPEETKELLYKNHLNWVMEQVSGKKTDRKEMEMRMIAVKKRKIPDWQKIILIADLNELKKENRMDEFVEIAVADVGEYFAEDPRALNSFAWTVFENTEDATQLEAALKWADMAIEQEKHPAVLDTKANLLYKLERKEEAVAAQEEAIELGREMGMPKGQLESFEKTLAKFKK